MYQIRRNRILRQSPAIRAMVAETILRPADFIAPLFITEGYGVKEEISSMPGYYRRSIDFTVQEVRELWQLGIKSVLLFIKCKDELKDNMGTEALNADGLMQRAIKAIKDAFPDVVVMTDVALDPFSTYGHDGIVEGNEIVNDPTVEVLAKMSVSHALAGADIVAPSDMMDVSLPSGRRWKKVALQKQGSWPIVLNTLPAFMVLSGMRWTAPRVSGIRRPTRWIMPTAAKP